MTNSQNNSDINNENTQTSSEVPVIELTDASSEETIYLEEIKRTHSGKHFLAVNARGKKKYKKRRKHRSKKHKYKLLKRILLGILIFLIAVAVILFSIYSYLHYKGKQELLDSNQNVTVNTIEDAKTEDNGQTVTYNGETYRFNEDLVSVVIMGIDQSELGSDNYGDAGQADAIYIFTYDTNSGKCTLIPVSRETMTDVRIYSTSGQEMGLEKMQLCLAYAYGDGKESSCANTLEALSRVFYNIPFDTYVTLNWDVIAPLNDVIGGVSLTALEDIEGELSPIKKGEFITLMGRNAFSYVKYRDYTKLESNPDRLNRQKQYIDAYVSKLIPLAKEDITIISKLYKTANEYMYTNLTQNKLIYIASEILPEVYSSKDVNFVSIEGKIKQGKQYAEFYPDETALYETILNVFYLKEIK